MIAFGSCGRTINYHTEQLIVILLMSVLSFVILLLRITKDFYSGVTDLETMIESWSEQILNSLDSLMNE